MPIGMDLLLCAVDANTGQARFGPKLSYSLPVAEVVCLAHRGRVGLRDDHLVIVDPELTGEPLDDSALSDLQELPATYPPLTVELWASWRGPGRIDRYLRAAVDGGIVQVVTEPESGRKTLAVVDPEPINQATHRLTAVLDESAPDIEDIAFAVLADEGEVAEPHLHGWDQHRHRARLSALRHIDDKGAAARILSAGCKAIPELARLATADPRNLDRQIGLTPAARTAMIFGIGEI
jgi:Golgi phosphoprotein 3 (GPP34)